MSHNEKYDLICSLGGNCAPAHNLRYRNMRRVSYPFDWTYFTSDEAVYKLAEGFKDGFKNYMQKENLKEIEKNPSHPERLQYEDTYGKIIWANHFLYCEDRDKDFQEVKEKFDRRFKRLVDDVDKADKICFIFSVAFYIKEDSFIHLSKVLKELYPNKNIKIVVLSFDAGKNETYKNDNVEVFYYKRKMNNKDYMKTNKEWRFLNNMSIPENEFGDFAVIGSFKKFDLKNLEYKIKYLFRGFYKKFNYNKYLELKNNKRYTNGNQIKGHKALALSLFRGFEKLNIKYTYNKITPQTKNLILLWADKKDLKICEKLKKENKIKRIVTVPTACKYDFEYMQWHFPEEECIDRSLYASDWVADICLSKTDEKYHHKIIAWPSGVEVPDIKPKFAINNSCIVYIKRVLDNQSVIDNLISFIEEQGIKCYVIKYNEYDFNYWQELLQKVDFVVFYQDYHETQGLALAEAWVQNKPSLVKNTVDKDGNIINNAPYLTPYTGLSWNNTDELKSIILEYKQNPEVFCQKFSPYDWVKENMSDEVSVKMLLDIFKSIEVSNE